MLAILLTVVRTRMLTMETKQMYSFYCLFKVERVTLFYYNFKVKFRIQPINWVLKKIEGVINIIHQFLYIL